MNISRKLCPFIINKSTNTCQRSTIHSLASPRLTYSQNGLNRLGTNITKTVAPLVSFNQKRFSSSSTGRNRPYEDPRWNRDSHLDEESQRRIAEQEVAETEHLSRNVFKEDAYQIAQALNDVGLVYYTQNKMIKAKPFFMRALELTKSQHPVNPSMLSTCLFNVASYYFQLKDYNNAIPFLQENIDHNRKNAEMETISITHRRRFIEGLDSLIHVYRLTNKHHQALQLCKESINQKKMFFGEDHAGVADTLNIMGMIHKELGEWSEAEKNFREAMDLSVSQFGEQHLSVASCKIYLGGAKLDQKDFKTAKKFFKEALVVYEKVWSAIQGEHPSVARCHHYLYLAHKGAGELSAAKKHLKAELQLVEKILQMSPVEPEEGETPQSILGEEPSEDEEKKELSHPKIIAIKKEMEELNSLEKQKKGKKQNATVHVDATSTA